MLQIGVLLIKSRHIYDQMEKAEFVVPDHIYDFAGGEFDWFLVDGKGRLALCSSAGFGEVPKSVLEGLSEDHLPIDELPQLIELLPPLGDCRTEGAGPGKCDEFKQLAARGIFVFDWKHWHGPYERILFPDVRLDSKELDNTVLSSLRPVHIEAVDLEHTTTFQVADFGIGFVAGNTYNVN